MVVSEIHIEKESFPGKMIRSDLMPNRLPRPPPLNSEKLALVRLSGTLF